MAKISVAMTTYNGSKYIIKQLDSLKNQSRKIDELVICDDCSTDNTVELVNDYIKSNNLEGWNMYSNENNLGFINNFKQAIKKTTGDIIFLCDQDDDAFHMYLPNHLPCLVRTTIIVLNMIFQSTRKLRSRIYCISISTHSSKEMSFLFG